MDTFKQLSSGAAKIAVVGLGYVGLPLAVAFAEKFKVIGFDLNAEKIEQYRKGHDLTMEVGDEAVAHCGVEFTCDEARLREASFVVVAVPTPINGDKTPDLTPVISASEIVGRNLRPGAIVVYESTVYPGVTEETCMPILQQQSGMECGTQFKIGYSPERINPGDKVHRLRTIRKVVSGMDAETLHEIQSIYDSIIDAGTYPVSTIKTAEAVKLVENSQRDINIAFMNEMALVFERMSIDTNEVVDGMNTKWNALGFRPGLVGGHCISVDPYYFVYEAARLGYTSRIVAAGRHVNDYMGVFVAEMAIKKMIQAGVDASHAKIVILGLTFKENCPDLRNTRVLDIIQKLEEYNVHPVVVDPWADPEDAKRHCGVELTPLEAISDADCIIHTVAHEQFRANGVQGLCELFRKDGAPRILIDVKGEWSSAEIKDAGVIGWRM